MSATRTLLISLVVLMASAAACGSPPPPPPTGGGKAVEASAAGTLTGRATFSGAPPAVQTIRMGIDKACVAGAGPNPQSDAVLIAADGGLKNVFVYVKDGLDPAYSFDIPTAPVVLDQKGCVYTPRVLGVRAGQPMNILNSDDTLHNVHAMPMANQEFNTGLPFKDTKLTHTFTVPEVMTRFKCDVHPWMAAHVGILAHPFFAVTDASGAFEIKGLPPGTYTFEAWHEKFGRLTSQVTIDAKGAHTTAFVFAATPPRQP